MTTVLTLRDAPDTLSIRPEADTEVRRVAREEDLAAELVSHLAGALVLGPGVERPLEVAQRAAQVDESLAIIIVADEATTRDLRLQMLYMPHLGGDLRFVVRGDAQTLRTTLREANRCTEARRRYKQLIRALPDTLPEWSPVVPRPFLDSLLEQAPIGVVMVGPGSVAGSVADAAIMACNPSAKAILHLQDQHVVGGQLDDLRAVTGCAALVEFLRTTLDDVQETQAATIFMDFGEHERSFCEVVVSRVQVDGQRAGSLALLRDVSGRVAAGFERRELDRRERDSERLREIGLLAGGIAHDFNNILVGILGFAELGLQRTAADGTLTRLLDGVVDAAHQACDLTNQMLAYAGRSPGEMERTDVNTLVTDLSPLLEASVAKGTIQLQLHPDTLPVMIDVSQWRRIILNLVTNAADSLGEDKGTILIKSQPVLLYERRRAVTTGIDLAPGPYVKLTVSDTGCGMKPVVLEHLFDPFYTTKENGRGLGLSAVLGIVRSHLGDIGVHSDVGLGSSFEILLPRCEQKGEEPSGHGTPCDESTPLILVIDDEPMVRTVAEMGLELRGFQVITTNNGREGIDALRANPAIQLVLLDLSMPVLDGRETLVEMERLGLRTPVILSSGYREKDTPAQVEFKNLVGFISKPFEIAQLAQKIADVLGLGRRGAG